MAVQITGEFITISDNTIKISEIISIKPQSLVKFNQLTGKIIARDFPKIIINTNKEVFKILYATDDERDNELEIINKSINEFTTTEKIMTNPNSINIQVTDSTNVNIVSQSNDVVINQKIKEEVNSKISELFERLETIKDIDMELKNDIIECLTDIKSNVESNKKTPKYSLKGLVDLTSKIASLSSLGIGIAQLLGA